MVIDPEVQKRGQSSCISLLKDFENLLILNITLISNHILTHKLKHVAIFDTTATVRDLYIDLLACPAALDK